MNLGDEDSILWESDIPSRHSQLDWKSETTQVASVDPYGYLTANNMGKTAIYGRYSTLLYKVEVEVLQKILYGEMGGFLKYKEPEIAASQEFDELIIYNKPWDGALYVGQTFAVGALPYPFDMWGDGVTEGSMPNYSVHWTSSAPDVAAIKNGIIQPFKAGKTTITATLYGTQLTDSFELTIKEKVNAEEKLYRANESAFTGLTPGATMQKIFDTITAAREHGYNGVLFPRMDYHVEPTQLGAFAIPTEFIVDFNYSNMYMEPWHDYVNGTYGDGTQNKHYTLFSFKNATHSVLRNLNYYGERYDTTHAESEYGEQTLFLYYSNGIYCEVYNCHFEGVAGFHICVGGETVGNATYLYKYANKVYYKNLKAGFLKADGTADETVEGYIYTPDFINISTEDYACGMYHMGTSYKARFGSLFNYTRFYNIAWYDADYNLLCYRTREMVYYDYDLPEGAAYYKMTMWRPADIALPTKNDDPRMANAPYSGVAMLSPSFPTYCCSMYNCSFKNTASGCLSGTGDSIGFRFYNNNLNGRDSVGKRNAWCYDFEDGWWGMFGNIYQNNSSAFRVAFAGVLTVITDSGGFTEAYLRVLQNTFFAADNYGYLLMDESVNAVTGYPYGTNHTSYGYRCENINSVEKEETNGS